MVVAYVMLKMVCIPSETNDYWKAMAYIIQMAFPRKFLYKYLYLLSHFREIKQNDESFLGDKKYLTERHVRYLCVQNA